MKQQRPRNAAFSLPSLLSAALLSMLALVGCVAPPATLYDTTTTTQSYGTSYPSQSYQSQPYQAQPYPTQPYQTQPYQQGGYPQQSPYYQAPQVYASYCSAGVYQCPVPGGTQVGTSCACPGLGAPSYGTAQ